MFLVFIEGVAELDSKVVLVFYIISAILAAALFVYMLMTAKYERYLEDDASAASYSAENKKSGADSDAKASKAEEISEPSEREGSLDAENSADAIEPDAVANDPETENSAETPDSPEDYASSADSGGDGDNGKSK